MPNGRQVTSTNAREVAEWVNQNGGCGSFDALSDGVLVSTSTDDLMAYPGDFVFLRQNEFVIYP